MELLLYMALIPALGVSAQWIAWRTNLPSILLLLLFGVALGQLVHPDELLAELIGGDESAAPRILFPIVSLAVAVIMFEGGLSLRLGELHESGTATLRLCTVGALVTLVGSAVAAYFVLDFGWRLSLLLGAILVVTGPTVIGPLLRQVRPTGRVAATLKWEGIVIDPIGAVLAVLVFETLFLHAEDASIGWAALILLKTAVVGLVLGAIGGALLTFAFRKFLVPDNLQGVASLAVGLLLFAVSDQLAHESGLITVTVLGVWLANQHDFDVEHIIEFKEHLRTLLIGCLFIVLGSRIDVADVIALGLPGMAMVACLILIVRPLSVFVSLLGNPLNMRERTFIAGLAPRGIVAAAVGSVFALKIEQSSSLPSVPGADGLATVVFFVIVGTVAIYGLSASPLARWLGLSDDKRTGVLIAGGESWIRDFAIELRAINIPVVLVDTNYNKISQARMAGLNAVCANILNERVRDELPLTGIGKMMAMTQNDEVNSLAVRECGNLFDRKFLYQLSFNLENQHYRRGLTKNLMGRELFNNGLTFSTIREMHANGAKFKRTSLTNEFTYDDYSERYGDGATLLCVIDGEGRLQVNTVDAPLKPVPGNTIVALVAVTTLPDDHAAVSGLDQTEPT